MIPPRRLARELRRTELRSERAGVELAQVRIPRSTECEHFLITGATGAGKSMAIRSLLRQIQARGELAIVVDPECEYVSEFYRPARGDLILNPIDERCPYWSPWLELSERYYQADAATLAASLIPEPPRGYESGSDHFFRQSSRTLLESLLQVAARREPQSIPEAARTRSRPVEAGTVRHARIQPDRSGSARAGRRDYRDCRQRDPTIPLPAARRRTTAVERAGMGRASRRMAVRDDARRVQLSGAATRRTSGSTSLSAACSTPPAIAEGSGSWWTSCRCSAVRRSSRRW